MIEVLTKIDGVLKLAVVRWLMLTAIIVLSVFTALKLSELKAVKLELTAEKGKNASLSAAIDAQNVAIKKAGEDMDALKKRAQNASETARMLQKQLERRKTEVREVVLQGDCPQMVQQILDEIRK